MASLAEISLLRFTFLFVFLIVFLSVCLCQRDCTGVDCPLLDNCIEEVLESGACCASCRQKGCTCEGYQYYDCINAGFKNGKVPEGDSYFVDYGSTECSCPNGGGRISCHFISCPDMPPNCIEVSEPLDGCMQCERVGCVHEGQKYDAGHSFHIDHCQVCHCPTEGGELMCYPVPNCDPEEVKKPMLSTPAEEGPYGFDQHESTSHGFPLTGSLPLFKLSSSNKEESEDYDYSPTDFPETYPQSLVYPTLPPISNKVTSVSEGFDRPDSKSALQSLSGQSKLELKERYGVHDHSADKEQVTESPLSVESSTIGSHVHKNDTTSWQPSQGNESMQRVTSSDLTEQNEFGKPLHTLNSERDSEHSHGISDIHPQRGSESNKYPQKASESVASRGPKSDINISHPVRGAGSQTNQLRQSDKFSFPLYSLTSTESTSHHRQSLHDPKELEETVAPDHEEGVDEKEVEEKKIVTLQEPEGGDVPDKVKSTLQETRTEESESSRPTSTYEKATPEPSTSSLRSPEYLTTPTFSFITTNTQQPERLTTSEREPDRRPGQGVFNLHSEDQEQVTGKDERKDPVLPVRPDADSVSSTDDLLGSCCAAGQNWASENGGCDLMPLLDPDRGSVCSVAQKQCCLSSVSESRCHSGVMSSRGGDTCQADEEERCADDPYQVCCSCCALGSLVRNQGRGCDAHRHLGYPCGHVFLACCEEEEGPSQTPLRRKQMPRPTLVPREVSPDEDNRVGLDGPAVVPTQTTTTTSTTTTDATPLHPCADNGPCGQRCTAAGGRAHCSCFPGYSLMTDGRTCEDVDECLDDTHRCGPGERCVNTVGSFVCELQVTCPPGHLLRNGVCEDIDECVLRTHDCGVGLMCENTLGSFRCNPKQKCMSGFRQDSHGNCIDINECSSLGSAPCSSGFNCINTVGSYSCQKKVIMCGRGYTSGPDGAKCVDVDECQTGSHRCGVGQICQNVPGSYRCDCQTGYQYDTLRKVCTDVNECWRYPGRLCAQTCENTPGSYHCSCTAGFTLAFDGKNCEDVNECDNNPCSQECANIYGSYQCYCRQGYYLKEDGRTCEDIDECSQSIGNLCAFQCVNVAGSYRCSCPPQGYVMSANGRTCRDIDECTSGSHNCSRRQTCYNLQGGFRCLAFDCPDNYKKVSDTRCERTSCPSNSVDCQNSPVRITYYQLSFQTNIIIPAQIFRIGPSPAYSGDRVFIGIVKGNEEGYFSTRKLNAFTGAVYLQRQVNKPKDFLIDVEMKLLRQGTFTSFLARIYVFITSNSA
ncbi:fibulin-2 isoform X2 [Antennarius striatus]|uniref:fibulin-2 isoform X2 n=1 Tax=Antennarius striatus TaxID=241820 RepID=UPI0035AF85D0